MENLFLGREDSYIRVMGKGRKPHTIGHGIAEDCEVFLVPLGMTLRGRNGYWTVRLLANKAVELGFVEKISPNTIHQLLKKMN